MLDIPPLVLRKVGFSGELIFNFGPSTGVCGSRRLGRLPYLVCEVCNPGLKEWNFVLKALDPVISWVVVEGAVNGG